MMGRARGPWLAAVLLVAALAASVVLAVPAPAQGAPPPPSAGGPVEVPPVTLLYQNFPNPFTPSTAGRTCIWFDLARDSEVRLEVFDLRGRRVKRILPFTGFVGVVPAGRYGRAITGQCDPVVSWDARDEDGRIVPSGVYLLRLEADGQRLFRKIVVQVL
jgi:hypothetical protein